MHQLHLVGFTADHDGLIFSTKKGATSGSYVVAFDDALFTALEEGRRNALAEPDDAAARAAAERVRALRPTQRSSLSVRDIQSRLRSGLTMAQVAAEAGVDEAWVSRFAAPVLAEQAAVVERAMRLFFTTPRKGTSSRPLGDAVRWNLLDKGVVVDTTPQAAGWSAFQLEPGRWAVRFAYVSRGRSQVAEWEVDLETGELTGRNRQASDLAYVEAGARRRKQVEVAPPTSPPAVKKATSGRKGTPARTKTARAQAARATSTKAAAARAKAAKPAPAAAKAAAPAPRGRQPLPTAADRGKGRTTTAGSSGRRAAASPAATATGTGRRAGQPQTPPPAAKRAGTSTKAAQQDPASTRRGGEASEKPSTSGLARFPAPRPASARPSETPSAPRPRPRPVPPAARRAEPSSRPARPAAAQAPASPRPADGPAVRRVAPPAPPPRRPEPTADARPMPVVAQAASAPAPASGPPPAPEAPAVIRRLPSPAPAASMRRVDRGSTEPDSATAAAAAPEPAPEPASAPAPAAMPSPEPPPAPPRSTPTVRPVGGGDGRPTILIIDADRAGDRRRS